MRDIKCFDYTTDKTKRKLMGKMIDKLEEKDKEIERLNNIIKHIYKELREFDVCNNMGVAIQISYLEEYIQKNIEQIEDKYLQELKEGKNNE